MARKLVVVVAIAAMAVGGFYAVRWYGRSEVAVAQQPQAPRAISVEVATAIKKDVPVLLEGIGNVTTMANVAVRSRLDNEIVEVHFADGAKVNKGDLLLILDQLSLQAQIK